ncbi:DGQHR domain-containing protein [Neobacillus niacini]|uniref:DGQHR domain-containing protein n=1 Tax=Neobacillus niacini TaxID=86668 RepID=UPI002FFD76B1
MKLLFFILCQNSSNHVKRVKSIREYSETNDAIFSTSIIISGSNEYVSISENILYIDVDFIKDNDDFFSIVDGQHRLVGISESSAAEKFTLPVILIFNTNAPEDAQIFSSINGNQKPVPKSLIYDLFSYADQRSLERTSHIIGKELNNNNNESPFFGEIEDVSCC